MANLKEIRNRIASVKNTRQITSAMSRIAAARLRRAQNAMEAARDYGERMGAVVRELVGELDDPAEAHLLLEQRRVERVLVIPVTADRGLCGGFNSGVIRATVKRIEYWRAEGKAVDSVFVGRKADPMGKLLALEPLQRHASPAIGKENTVVARAKDAAADALGCFLPHDPEQTGMPRVDRVELVYNHFKNVITQEVRVVPLLPFSADGGTPQSEPRAELELHGGGQGQEGRHAVRGYEPDMKTMLEHLLPIAVETAVQQAFFNSAAAEIAARRQAMDSATDNATDLIGELTLEYNRERQAAITKELMEIVGGAEALKG